MTSPGLSMGRFICICLVVWNVVTTVSGHEETTGCQWSHWTLETPCADPIKCGGQRTDTRTRKCPETPEENETKDVACDGECRPCTAWSEWSRPYAQRRGDTYGRERRYRDCFYAFLSGRTLYEYRTALCLGCPVCGTENMYGFTRRC